MHCQGIYLFHSQPEVLSSQKNLTHSSLIKNCTETVFSVLKLCYLFLYVLYENYVKYLFAKQTNKQQPQQKELLSTLHIDQAQSYVNILPTSMLSNSMLLSHAW